MLDATDGQIVTTLPSRRHIVGGWSPRVPVPGSTVIMLKPLGRLLAMLRRQRPCARAVLRRGWILWVLGLYKQRATSILRQRQGRGTRLLMLWMGRHDRHPIILRELQSLRGSLSVAIVDVNCPSRSSDIAVHRSVRRVGLGFFQTTAWKILRLLFRGRLAELYWTALAVAEELLTAIILGYNALRSRADIFHAHDVWSLVGAHLAGALSGTPVIYDCHELASEQHAAYPLRRRALQLLEHMLLPRSDLVIVPNRSRAEVYDGQFDLGNRLLIIENCPTPASYKNTKKIHQTLGLPDESKVVLYHGAFMEGRCLDILIKSSRYFLSDVKLVLIGERNEYFHNVLDPLIKASNNYVFTLPYIENQRIMDYVASADLGIVIYQNTNLNNYLCAPTKLYDFIMACVPVAACDFPGVREVFDRYPVGLTFEPESPQSIADAVNGFFSLDAERLAQIHRALDDGRRVLNWDDAAKPLATRLQALAASGKRR